MKLDKNMSDQTVLAEVGARVQGLRLERNLTQGELARESGLSKITVERLEAGQSTELRTLIRAMRVLGLLELLNLALPEPLPSPIDALRLRGKVRRRATGSRATPASAIPAQGRWNWAERPGPGAG
ncbi:MAG: helix-turn-helix transcriptional regulator [Candidatus Dormiibacterota bacterium]